jgi:hypothetical protein
MAPVPSPAWPVARTPELPLTRSDVLAVKRTSRVGSVVVPRHSGFLPVSVAEIKRRYGCRDFGQSPAARLCRPANIRLTTVVGIPT